MMQAADLRNRRDVAITRHGDRTGHRRVLVQRQVRAAPLVIVNIAGQDVVQARFVKHDHVVEALAPYRPDQPFGIWILPGRTRRCEHFVDAHGLRCVCPGLERVIAIANEISRGLIPGERVAQLLHGPRGRRMRGYRHMDDSAAFVGEDHQHEQQPTGRGRYDKEVRRHDLPDVIRKEGLPGL
jgi:hypothetical protein